jgi:hypothetical protein
VGFRFRRTVRVLPGIKINLNKHDASLSVGGRGAHVTLRPNHKPRATVGIPGSGLSYTQGGEIDRPETPTSVDSGVSSVPWWAWALAVAVIGGAVGLILH